MSVFVPVSQYFDYCSFVVSFEVQNSNFVLFFKIFLCIWGASLVAQRLKHLPAMQETLVQSLGQEDPLEKEMATHSSILAWRIPWREEAGRLQSMGSQRVGHNWATSLHFTSRAAPRSSQTFNFTLCRNRKKKSFAFSAEELKGEIISTLGANG